MAIHYIETYSTPAGYTFGIEDHADGLGEDQHFFHHDYLEGKAKRFRTWSNGCGIGNVDTLEEARKLIADHIMDRSRAGVAHNLKQLCAHQVALENAHDLALFRDQ